MGKVSLRTQLACQTLLFHQYHDYIMKIFTVVFNTNLQNERKIHYENLKYVYLGFSFKYSNINQDLKLKILKIFKNVGKVYTFKRIMKID